MDKEFIILDRDGVINYDSDNYIRNADEWIPIAGSIDAICLLSRSGYTVTVATNQSGLARGFFNESELAAMHGKLTRMVEEGGGELAGIFSCPHLPDDNCTCRKPATGLLDQIEARFDTSLKNCFYVGDSEKDIDCALAKSCKPLLVLTGKGSLTLEKLSQEKRKLISVFDDLFSAAMFILSDTAQEPDN